MSQPKPPQPAKLVIGVFTNDKRLIGTIVSRLSELFGAIEVMSPMIPFDYTDYYKPEMGSGLVRRMIAFKPLIAQDTLSTIKLKTNIIENEFSSDARRNVNIDPGYLVRERFVLATGKNFTHRIYIGNNIYADLTLIFQKGGFRPLPWTYPDYMEKNMHAFLYRVRNKYIKDLTGLES
jgi:uncharacterized protein DUF4416